MRSFLKPSLLLVLILGLAVATLAQNPGPTPPGWTINWTITLASLTAGGPSGTAHYIMYKSSLDGKGYMKFSVECEYVEYPDLTVLDVYLKGSGSSLGQPPRMVGSMEVQNHGASLLLLTSRTPEITKGTQVIVRTRTGDEIMAGRF